MLISLGMSSVWASYVMPVGVPNVSLDFEATMPDRPTDWSSNQDGYYYVNYQTGSDSNGNGTPSNPRQTLPSLTDAAGSYIEIAGEYTNGFTSRTNRMHTINGSAGAWVAGVSGPVWITSAKDVGGSIKFMGFQIKGSNLYISDLTFTDKAYVQIGSISSGYPISNVVIRNSDFDGGSVSVLGHKDVGGSSATNIIVYNNEIHNGGDMWDENDSDVTGVQIGTNVRNLWVLDNHIHHMSGAGVQVLGSDATTNNIYVGRNVIHDVRQSGLWVKRGDKVVFSTNHVYDVWTTYGIIPKGGSRSPSKGIGAQYEPHNLWVINNIVHGVTYGIRVPSTTGGLSWNKTLYVIGNIVYDVEPRINSNGLGDSWTTEYNVWQPAAIQLGGDIKHIYNNLVMDSAAGISIMNNTGPDYVTNEEVDRTAYIKNNIIYNMTKGREANKIHLDNDGFEMTVDAVGASIIFEGSVLGADIFIENNYMDSNPVIRRGTETYYTVAELETAGHTGNYSGAQLFSSAELQAAMTNNTIAGMNLAALVDSGSDVSAILVDDFKATFPGTLGVTSDIFGMARVQGSGTDIGGFESGGVVAIANTLPPLVTDTGGEVTAPATSVITGSVSLNLDEVAGWYVPKMLDKNEAGNLTFSDVTYSSAAYKINYSKFSTNKSGVPYSTGYSYVIGNTNSEITGSVTGTGNADVYLMSNNYSGNTLTYSFTVNGDTETFNNSSGFQQNKVTIESTGSTGFSYKVVSGDAKSAIGISAIVEK